MEINSKICFFSNVKKQTKIIKADFSKKTNKKFQDHFALMTAFHDKGDGPRALAGRYMWVIFNIWQWTPMGAMWAAHGKNLKLF